MYGPATLDLLLIPLTPCYAGWDHLKSLRGHTGAVSSLSVHCSGRVALSVSADLTIRMWNLVKGKSNFCTKLDRHIDVVAFSPSGDSYSLLGGDRVTVLDTGGEGSLRASLSHERRVLCMAQHSDQALITGSEDGTIRLWDLRTSAVAHSIQRAHASRLKGLAIVHPGGAGSAVPQQLASAASDGIIRLWDTRMLAQGQPAARLAEVSTGARLTCLVATRPTAASESNSSHGAAKKSQGEESAGERQAGQAGGRAGKREKGTAAAASVAGGEGQKRAAADAASELGTSSRSQPQQQQVASGKRSGGKGEEAGRLEPGKGAAATLPAAKKQKVAAPAPTAVAAPTWQGPSGREAATVPAGKKEAVASAPETQPTQGRPHKQQKQKQNGKSSDAPAPTAVDNSGPDVKQKKKKTSKAKTKPAS